MRPDLGSLCPLPLEYHHLGVPWVLRAHLLLASSFQTALLSGAPVQAIKARDRGCERKPCPLFHPHCLVFPRPVPSSALGSQPLLCPVKSPTAAKEVLSQTRWDCDPLQPYTLPWLSSAPESSPYLLPGAEATSKLPPHSSLPPESKVTPPLGLSSYCPPVSFLFSKPSGFVLFEKPCPLEEEHPPKLERDGRVCGGVLSPLWGPHLST